MKIKGCMQNSHPIWQLLIWVLLMAVLTFTMMAAYMLYAPGSTTDTINNLRMLQAAQALCLFILPALLSATLWSHRPLERLALNKGFHLKTAALTILMIIIAQPGINLISWWNESWQLPEWLNMMEEQTDDLTKQLAYSENLVMLLVNITVMAILPGLGEELCFRGVLLGFFSDNSNASNTKKRTIIGVWVVAIIFSAIHMQFAGFLPRMVLGAVLGYLLVWSGSLWLPILAHSINNAFVVVMYYLGDHTTITAESIDEFGRGDTWWIGAISITLTLLLLWLTRNAAQKQS